MNYFTGRQLKAYTSETASTKANEAAVRGVLGTVSGSLVLAVKACAEAEVRFSRYISVPIADGLRGADFTFVFGANGNKQVVRLFRRDEQVRNANGEPPLDCDEYR